MSSTTEPAPPRSEAPNAMHCGGSTGVAWSTTNAGEAIPGVVTPLTWSFFGDRTEEGTRGAFCDLGVLSEAQVRRPPRPEDRLWDIFFGRAAVNVDTLRKFADGLPGTSGDALELDMLGSSRPHVSSRANVRRYPVVAVKAPYGLATLRRRLLAATEQTEPWWRHSVGPGAPTDGPAARALLVEAAAGFLAVMRPHTFAAFLCQGLYEQVRLLAVAAGRPGLENSLVTGYGDMSETAFVADLWDVSRGKSSLDDFVAAHGYHGPNEGELAAQVWRLDRRPLERLLLRYAELPDEQDPRRVQASRSKQRREAEQELLGATSGRVRRARAKAVLGLAERYISLRGTGKASFLQCVDVARVAVGVLGEEHVRAGRLAGPRDVFMLTLDELSAPTLPAGVQELVAERRAQHERYRQNELPDFWEGQPEVRAKRVAAADDRTTVTGTAVSPGVVEGVARVVDDPEEDDGPDEGEVLVCRTTDPSWASVMVVSAALVIDIGGPISHGAIVARELGIPCVIGTGDGTLVIRTGDRVRVDGAKGEVEVLERAAAPEIP